MGGRKCRVHLRHSHLGQLLHSHSKFIHLFGFLVHSHRPDLLTEHVTMLVCAWPSVPYENQGNVSSLSMVRLHSHHPWSNGGSHARSRYSCFLCSLIVEKQVCDGEGLTVSSVMVFEGNYQSDYYWVLIYCLPGSAVINPHSRVNKERRDVGIGYCCCYQMVAQHTPPTGRHW